MTANMMHLLPLIFRFQLSPEKDDSFRRFSCQVESAMRVRQTLSAFNLLAKRNAFASRWASATQIVWPSRSKAETQPKLHAALWRLSAMICQSFTRSAVLIHRLFSTTCDTDLLRSSCAFTFCRSVVSSA